MFVIASRITLAEMGHELRQSRLLLKIFLIMSLVVPLLTAGIVKLLPVPMLLGGVILIGAVTLST